MVILFYQNKKKKKKTILPPKKPCVIREAKTNFFATIVNWYLASC